MDSKTLYKSLSRVSILLNLILCLGAVFLVERLVPAVSSILRQNSDSIQASSIMLETLALVSYSRENPEQEKQFWYAMNLAKSSIAFKAEVEVLAKIDKLAVKYWAGEFEVKQDLLFAIRELLVLNVEDMKTKQRKVRKLGLGGTWALALVLILLVGFQLFFRQRIFTTLVNPVGELCLVLKEYYNGNKLRRFYSADASKDIQEAGRLLNDLLDSNRKRF
jgi:hypothetical protein